MLIKSQAGVLTPFAIHQGLPVFSNYRAEDSNTQIIKFLLLTVRKISGSVGGVVIYDM